MPRMPASERWWLPRIRTRVSSRAGGQTGRRPWRAQSRRIASRGSHGTRVPLSVHADPRRRPDPQEPHLLHRARRGHGRGGKARPTAPRVPRGEGAWRMRADDLRRVLERPPVLARERVEHAREPRRLDPSRLSRDGGGDPSARLPRLHPAHPHGPARTVGQRELARAPRAVPDPGARPPGDPARDGPRSDRDDRARVRRRRATVPRRRARRGRALIRPQPPGRPVLVPGLQPAGGRVRRDPRQPDALRIRGPARDPPAGRHRLRGRRPHLGRRVHRRGSDGRRHGRDCPPARRLGPRIQIFDHRGRGPLVRASGGRGTEHVVSERRVRSAGGGHQGGLLGDPRSSTPRASSTRCTRTRSWPTDRSTWWE